jgi:hypothetical protein
MSNKSNRGRGRAANLNPSGSQPGSGTSRGRARPTSGNQAPRTNESTRQGFIFIF